MMIQPFIGSTQTMGEKSVAWIDGEITHAWIKFPRFAGEDESVRPAQDISAEDRHIVEKCLADLHGKILYARVDLMYDDDGALLLSELELIEPSMQFRFSAAALKRFARALVQKAVGYLP